MPGRPRGCLPGAPAARMAGTCRSLGCPSMDPSTQEETEMTRKRETQKDASRRVLRHMPRAGAVVVMVLMAIACGATPDGSERGPSASLAGSAKEDTAAIESAASACGGLGAGCCHGNTCAFGNLTCKNKKCRLKDGSGCD